MFQRFFFSLYLLEIASNPLKNTQYANGTNTRVQVGNFYYNSRVLFRNFRLYFFPLTNLYEYANRSNFKSTKVNDSFNLGYLQVRIRCWLPSTRVKVMGSNYSAVPKRHEAKENVYETEKFLGDYLIFHFGKPDELLPYGFGPTDSLDFPKRCALECIKHAEVSTQVKSFCSGCRLGPVQTPIFS